MLIYTIVIMGYGFLLNATNTVEVWDKILLLSPFVGGFLLGVVGAVWFYERHNKREDTQTQAVNAKIKELSDHHVEEFKTLSEQQLERYDKEMATKDELIKEQNASYQNAIKLWHNAVKEGIDNQEKTAAKLQEHYENLLTKKDGIIDNERAYTRERENEMNQTLMTLKAGSENIMNHLLNDYPDKSNEFNKLINKLSQDIELLHNKLDKV